MLELLSLLLPTLARLFRSYDDPRVRFLGHIADEADRISVLRGADAFFLPSSVEGLSLAMLEAMACGMATVVTDVGGDGDAVRGAGIVLDPGDLAAELRLAIRLLLEMPWLAQELGRAARRRAESRYSLEGNVDSLGIVYEEVTKRTGTNRLFQGGHSPLEQLPTLEE